MINNHSNIPPKERDKINKALDHAVIIEMDSGKKDLCLPHYVIPNILKSMQRAFDFLGSVPKEYRTIVNNEQYVSCHYILKKLDKMKTETFPDHVYNHVIYASASFKTLALKHKGSI